MQIICNERICFWNGWRRQTFLAQYNFSEFIYTNENSINNFLFSSSATIVESFESFWVNQISGEVQIDPFGETTEKVTIPLPEIEEINVYEGCDVTKTCFGIPSGCINSQSCSTIGAVIYADDKFTFEIRSSSNFFNFLIKIIFFVHLKFD